MSAAWRQIAPGVVIQASASSRALSDARQRFAQRPQPVRLADDVGVQRNAHCQRLAPGLLPHLVEVVAEHRAKGAAVDLAGDHGRDGGGQSVRHHQYLRLDPLLGARSRRALCDGRYRSHHRRAGRADGPAGDRGQAQHDGQQDRGRQRRGNGPDFGRWRLDGGRRYCVQCRSGASLRRDDSTGGAGQFGAAEACGCRVFNGVVCAVFRHNPPVPGRCTSHHLAWRALPRTVGRHFSRQGLVGRLFALSAPAHRHRLQLCTTGLRQFLCAVSGTQSARCGRLGRRGAAFAGAHCCGARGDDPAWPGCKPHERLLHDARKLSQRLPERSRRWVFSGAAVSAVGVVSLP